MLCPACKAPLTALTMYSTGLDFCQDGCGGLWLDGGELERVLKAKQPAAKPTPLYASPSNGERKCPICADQKLQAISADRKGDIEVDACPACRGCWLDRGELEAIAATYHAGGVEGLAQELPVSLQALKTPPKAYKHGVSDAGLALANDIAEDIVKPWSFYGTLFQFIGGFLYR